MFSFVFMLIMIIRSRMTYNCSSDLETVLFELNILGHNCTQAVLCMWLKAYNHMEALSCMQLGVKL